MRRPFWLLVFLLAAAPASAARPKDPVAVAQGFRASASGGELFVTLDKASSAPPVLRETKDGVEVIIPHVRIKKPFRRLDARCFNTALRTVITKRRGRDLHMAITTKEKYIPRLDVKDDSGTQQIVLAFGSGTVETYLRPEGAPVASDEGTTAMETDYSQLDFSALHAARAAGAAGKDQGAGATGGGDFRGKPCSVDCRKLEPEEMTECISACTRYQKDKATRAQEDDRNKRAAAGDPGALKFQCVNACLVHRQKGDEPGYLNCAQACLDKYPSRNVID